MAATKFYVQHSADDANYLGTLSMFLGGKSNVRASKDDPVTLTNVITKARAAAADAILVTDVRLLELLTPDNPKPSIDASAGSYFEFGGMQFLVLLPLKQLFTVNYGQYVLKRILSKVTHPHLWFKETEFMYSEVTDDDIPVVLAELEQAEYLVIDIETPVHPDKLIIGDYGVTGVYWNSESRTFYTRSYVVDVDSMAKVEFMRRCNLLPAPKIGQNFKYDLAFMHKWNAPVHNWRFDTINMMHSWLAELPKDLAFITLLMVRNAYNWKYGGRLADRPSRIRYNALDTWATANAFLALAREMPEWAVANYHKEFPINFPSFLMESQGVRVNKDNFAKAKVEREVASEAKLASIRRMVNNPSFNPNSSKQCIALFKVLGFKDCTSTGEKELEKYRFRSAIAGRIVRAILDYRGIAKEINAYLKPSVIWQDRCYFAVNPHGTDTGRMAAREHQFNFGTTDSNRKNIGLNLQTIPRGDEDEANNFELGVKHIFEGDSDDEGDFLFGEADYEQAEARDVAYLSGDEALIHAVDCGKDFHSSNASSFFGIPYEEIYDDAKKKTINKPVRNLAKKVNHGANYNMGAYVLITTMGEEKVVEARKLLGLPVYWTLEQVAEYLLKRYEATYPNVKGRWYNTLKLEVKTTGLLVGGTGWTRKCFGDPSRNKRDLNAYVAQKPQNLNAMTLSMAVMKVFYYALKHPTTFRLSMQIHDSILFQYRRGHDYHAAAVVDMMTFPVPIKDSIGKVRDLIVPAAVNHGARIWGDIKD